MNILEKDSLKIAKPVRTRGQSEIHPSIRVEPPSAFPEDTLARNTPKRPVPQNRIYSTHPPSSIPYVFPDNNESSRPQSSFPIPIHEYHPYPYPQSSNLSLPDDPKEYDLLPPNDNLKDNETKAPMPVLDPNPVPGASVLAGGVDGGNDLNNAREEASDAKSDPFACKSSALCSLTGNGAYNHDSSGIVDYPEKVVVVTLDAGNNGYNDGRASSTSLVLTHSPITTAIARWKESMGEPDNSDCCNNSSAEGLSDCSLSTGTMKGAHSGCSQISLHCNNSSPHPIVVNDDLTITTSPHVSEINRNVVINRADLKDIQTHKAHLDGSQRRLLQMSSRKVELFPQRYGHDSYQETASMLALSNWPSAERLSFCGIPSAVNKSGQCRLHQFCPYCCWKVRTKAQFTYVPSFYDTNWHFLTGSFCGDLGFTGSDGYCWLDYWNAYKAVLSDLVNEGLINGVYWTEELAVNSFLPTHILPHVHAIIDADDLTDTTLELLKAKVDEYLNNHLEPDHLTSNIKVEAIHDEKGLLDRIGYMNKTMKLLRPYERSWTAAALHDRTWAQRLNSNVTDFIKGHSIITRCRPKMNAKGTLNSKDKRFIGVKVKDHQQSQHIKLITELKLLPTEFIEVTGDDAQASSL